MSNEMVTAGRLAGELRAQFLDAFYLGQRAFKEAGVALVKLVEADPSAVAELAKQPGLGRGILTTLMRIGRGELLVELATNKELARLPIADQERVVKGDVEALVMRPDGSVEMMRVDLLKADKRTYAQVVGREGIRSLGEQRAVLVSRENQKLARNDAAEKKPATVPWRLEGKGVFVTAGTHLDRRDVLAMLNAMP